MLLRVAVLAAAITAVYAMNCTVINKITECQDVRFKENEPLMIKNYTKSLRLHPLIQVLPSRAFVFLTNITTLIINYTMIERIHEQTFARLENLQYLDLFWNQIQIVPKHVFRPCPNLIHLNLGGNNIETLHAEVFTNLIKLRELILSANQLNTIPNLHTLKNLQYLDLSKNRIKDMKERSFEGLHSLKQLNLKGNIIGSVQASSFGGLNNLIFLNLERNELTGLDVTNLKTYLPKLYELRIAINEFPCPILKSIIMETDRIGIYVPEGLAEPDFITFHGIFCVPPSSQNQIDSV